MRIKESIIFCIGMVLFIAIGTGTVSAVTIIVNDSTGPVADFTSIQAAIDNANDGDTILVYPGTYNENVDVDKTLNITSTDGASVTKVIAALTSDHVFEVTTDGVTINGFNVKGGESGIYIYSSCYDNTLTNNIAGNNYYGIYLDQLCGYNTLTNNIVSSNTRGIYMDDSDDNTLTGNTVSSNTYGIYMDYYSSENTFTNNIVSDNFIGIYMEYFVNHNLIYNNFFNNSQNAYLIMYNPSNIWNITKTTGTNIVGGSGLGGNYWAKPNEKGFSQTCTDTDGDGICDSSYVMDAYNIDYLPLTDDIIITVDDSGDADYTSIQAAVDAANPGYTILVYPGTYNENVDVDKTLNITSTDGASVTKVIAALTSDHVFEVTANEVTINGFNVSRARGGIYSSTAGIYLGSSNNILINNIAADNNYGIYLYSSSNNTLTNNIATDNLYYGIGIGFSDNNTLTDNTVSENNYNGINLRISDNNTLTNNIAADNAYTGINLRSSNNNTLTDNMATHHFEYGIHLDRSENNMLINNTVSGCFGEYAYGIYLDISDNNTLINNTASNNAGNNDGAGIYIASYNCRLISNTASHNDNGICIRGSYNTLKDNIAADNFYDGIYMSGDYSTLISNTASHNDNGIHMYRTHYSTLKDNTVSENSENGIYLDSSSNNFIYNNFFFNTNNAYFDDYYEPSTNNFWNTTKNSGTNIAGGPSLGGNYWATPDGTGFSQTCNDTNNDGFCDSIYVLGANNTDYLPLTDDKIPKFVDVIAPVLDDVTPTNGQKLTAGTTTVDIRFNYSDIQTGINASALVFTFDGTDVTTNATVTDSYVSYNATGLIAGTHSASVYVVDYEGNSQNFSTSFSIEKTSIIGISGSMTVLGLIAVLLAAALIQYRERR